MPRIKMNPHAAHGKARKGTFGRLMKYLFKYHKVAMITVFFCLILTAVSNAAAPIFLNNMIKVIGNGIEYGNLYGAAAGWNHVYPELIKIIVTMICIYILGIGANTLYTQLMANVTQTFLHQLRTDLFDKMQKLPIKYFDTHTHGDIMSHYTNDVDAVRQLVSQSIPNLFSAITMLVFLLCIMLYYSIWLSLIVFLGVFFMFLITKNVGGKSGKFFLQQQMSLGKTEGFIEEMMHGQKVVKVFCHEEEAEKKFDLINEQLCNDSTAANTFANILMPIMVNVGNLLYVVLAFLGGILAIQGLPNLSITGISTPDTISYIAIIVSFLSMSRQFTNNISNMAQQMNSVVMGLAGADRVFVMMDEKPEEDEGYVTLVNANIDENGNITESETRTGKWAWRHPHKADGTVTYTELKGDIRMFDVDFGYVPDKIVLHDVTLYAEPGQKVAFVGATGAGKTTITNLINRFYDIADGKIRYDGININKIKKGDLRRSLGMVLQDTNLFTGTVMDNIRYGKLDATDEECIAAAKLANAHDFITRLPEGYNTMLTGDGANLSQGQRQLLSIARAAVKNAPVMILDEATSSIDTHTEALVQRGTDKLMEGRTVFVIAHRLSTVQNSDVIMVLDHGRIIERGTHDQLIAEKGTYYQLYTGAFELE